ncbi:ATP-binding cassette domain-containing protein [Pseudoalteromonas sp. JBTF-M23]|uniref:ATP-binding cassette domain-containing protein n=1 Tax=Pseudoalteromonas caenipelagi TaxID=2726988 RepID=A0A849VB36_9GAMM|nr:ATP-binding cassette domain-containing protein [Pseudoalteromonas caenipelagi]NOU50496.1 ATP-binding cassette domain-containing protein [Pseudoalteromonas caenipelagi]
MLKINNIDKKYADGTHALKDISLELSTGMVGLLGPNGAGKSSLMRTLACLQSPDSGSYHFNNINCLTSPHELRQTLGYLPQYFGVYPHMSCKKLLEHIAVLKGLNRAEFEPQIEELLTLTNLKYVENKAVASFSGGMKQRFGIAQTLLGNPSFLIMDEPTSGLDPAERERLHDVLVSISQDRLVILSTHIVEDIENLCHHVALLIKGEIVESADVQTLIAPLEGRVWQSDHAPILAGEVTVLSKNYRFGIPAWRILSEAQPTPSAQLTEATLQDRYFWELNKKEHEDVVTQ